MKDFGWVFRFGEELGSFLELVKRIFTRPRTVALFATTAWLVWYYRNKTRLNETTLPLGQIVNFAHDYIRDYKALKRCSSNVCHVASAHWSPLDQE